MLLLLTMGRQTAARYIGRTGHARGFGMEAASGQLEYIDNRGCAVRQFLNIGQRQGRVGFVQAADSDTNRIDPLDQQVVATDIGWPAAEEPQNQQPASPGEAAQRLLADIGADRVVDDVDASA